MLDWSFLINVEVANPPNRVESAARLAVLALPLNLAGGDVVTRFTPG
jgi:hypothetical protein